MRIDYGAWGSLDITELISHIPEDSRKDVKTIVGELVSDAYDDGVEDGMENYSNYSDDSRFEDSINDGGFDDVVKARAIVLGFTSPRQNEDINDFRQAKHRELHPEGSWGWEYCSRC